MYPLLLLAEYMNEYKGKDKAKAFKEFIDLFDEDSSRNEAILKKYVLD